MDFFKRLSREPNNIPIEKSKLYDHFKYLNNALEASQISVNMNDDNDDLNVSITHYREWSTFMYEKD